MLSCKFKVQSCNNCKFVAITLMCEEESPLGKLANRSLRVHSLVKSARLVKTEVTTILLGCGVNVTENNDFGVLGWKYDAIRIGRYC